MPQTPRLATTIMSATVLKCVYLERVVLTPQIWSVVMVNPVQTTSATQKTGVTQLPLIVVTGMPVTETNSVSLERVALLALHRIVMMEAPVQKTHVSLQQGVTMPGFTVLRKSTT